MDNYHFTTSGERWSKSNEFSLSPSNFEGIWDLFGISYPFTEEEIELSHFFVLCSCCGKMMAEDLAVEAKESAVREVAKLLPLPELLQSIASIKTDYISRQQVSFPCSLSMHFCCFFVSQFLSCFE